MKLEFRYKIQQSNNGVLSMVCYRIYLRFDSHLDKQTNKRQQITLFIRTIQIKR